MALATAVVAALAFVATAVGIAGPATYGAIVSGDEPQYLLTAMSLGEDGGLDISDEIADERFRPFHEVDLLSQSLERPDGTRVSPHDPLLPALLAVPMLLGGWIGAKLALALLGAALAALMLWTAVRRFAVPLRPAAIVVGIFACSAPLVVYGQQVYPEVPAAVATLAAVAALTGRLGRSGLVILCVAVLVLPWLAVKYVPVAAALALIGLIRLWRSGTGRRQAAVLAGVLAVAGAGYVAAHLAWYGGLTVYAAGDFFADNGGQVSVLGTEPNYPGRAQRLLGLLVGRTFGVVAWQPAWLLAVPAAAALIRRRPAGWLELGVPLVVAWLMATFAAATMQGWWFPGRQIVIVLPLAVIAIAWWVGVAPSTSRAHVRRLLLTVGLGALGVWSYAWLAAQAAVRELTWIVDFFETADPWYRFWRHALPDYLDVTATTWVLHAVWLAVVAVAAAWGWRSAATRQGRPARPGSEDRATALDAGRLT